MAEPPKEEKTTRLRPTLPSPSVGLKTGKVPKYKEALVAKDPDSKRDDLHPE